MFEFDIYDCQYPNDNYVYLTVSHAVYNALSLIVKCINNYINSTKFKMFTIFRRIKLIEPNIRICANLIKTPTKATFASGYTPKALKSRKSKAKDEMVSQI